jgi:hypothetical protein
LAAATSLRIAAILRSRSAASSMLAASWRMRMSTLPPSWMSVPRPAMLVAMVTAPSEPAWAMM